MTSVLAARPIDKRLRPLYATGFIHGFALWYPIEKLFMRSIGMSDYLITVATLVYIVVMMTATIPLGVLADRWSRKGVLYVATCALVASSLVCGLSDGLAMYAAGISAWGLFYAAYAGTYDSVTYDVVLEETGSAAGFEHYYGRVQMFNSAAFITGALLSMGVTQFASLRLAYFLTIPFTCCAFLTLHRFREPSLHRTAPPTRLPAHLGQILRGATRADVTWIIVALVANCLAMRLLIEFCQLWYLGLALPMVWYGPSCALLYSGAWSGGALADWLLGRRMVLVAGFGTLAITGGLFVRSPAVVIGAQVAAIVGITVLNIALTRYLHDAMPSSIRAGTSSVVSTIGYGVFIPTALGFGLLSRARGIFEASAFVTGALGVMCIAAVCARRRIHRPRNLPEISGWPQFPAAEAVGQASDHYPVSGGLLMATRPFVMPDGYPAAGDPQPAALSYLPAPLAVDAGRVLDAVPAVDARHVIDAGPAIDDMPAIDAGPAIAAADESHLAVDAGQASQAVDESQLRVALRIRNRPSGSPACLEQVVAADDAAAAAPGRLSDLGVALLGRYRRTADPTDLYRAITMIQAASTAATGAADPRYAIDLSNLSGARRGTFGWSQGQDANDAAIAAASRGVRESPSDDPSQALHLLNLGSALRSKFERTGEDRHAAAAIRAFVQAAAMSLAPPSTRARAARAGAALAAARDPALAAGLLGAAAHLLPQIAPRELSRPDQDHALGGFTSIASDAAAMTLGLGTPGCAAEALGLLELGRAVLLSQAIDAHGDVSELRARHPVLAARFRRLRDQLDPAGQAGHGSPGDPPEPDPRHAAAEFAAVLAEIRSLAGFAGFLLPPEPEQLTLHSAFGPVVVLNASVHGCAAIIIASGAVSHLPLPGLALATLAEKVSAFYQALDAFADPRADRDARDRAQDVLSGILEWLWDTTAEPVLRHLGHTATPAAGAAWPHIWWAPGGQLGALPLHAAGYHRAPGSRSVMDRVVSSYTPTVRALARARALAQARAHAQPAGPEQSVIVAMPSTPGAAPLPNVAEEAAMLSARLPRPALLLAASPAGPAPTKDTVLAHLAVAGMAHFACHVAIDPARPAQARILLEDHATDPLLVISLAKLHLDRAQLAYLSAGRTSRNPSAALLDEAIHLAAAFQLAGYPHVVGTLWQVSDQAAVRVASEFYDGLQTGPGTFDTSGTARALHAAVRHLRDTVRAKPFLWAAYLHAGA